MKKSKIHQKDSKHKKPVDFLQSISQRVNQAIYKDVSISSGDFTECFQSVDISDCLTQNRCLSTKKLIKKLEHNYEISTQNQEIRYYLEEGQIWLLCPKGSILIDEDDYLNNQEIKLELIETREYIDTVMENSQEGENSENMSDQEEVEGDLKCRRLKQRKIKHVIQKVLKWRELYAGVNSKEEYPQKISLEDGAKIVKISKKTLDDYLSQIKKGKKYGFNFNQHKNQKIGILREFIRKAEKSKRK